MDNAALTRLALDTFSGPQKELAAKLGVSPTQISKWKRGEHMSSEMEQRLREIARIGDKDPAFVLLAGSLENATKWERLIHFLADVATESAETGYNTEPLKDPYGTLCWGTLDILQKMGITLPKEFPKDLDADYEKDGEIFETIEQNKYSSVVLKIYKSLNDVYGFYAAYIDEIIYDDALDLINTSAANIEPCLMSLAAAKIEIETPFAPRFTEFRYEIEKDYEEWLLVVKEKAFRAGIPLRAEITELVNSSSHELSHEAERESFGFNASRLHPDVYMNELLVGMRTIHQVLPVILKKLGIAEEFEVDISDLQLSKRRQSPIDGAGPVDRPLTSYE